MIPALQIWAKMYHKYEGMTDMLTVTMMEELATIITCVALLRGPKTFVLCNRKSSYSVLWSVLGVATPGRLVSELSQDQVDR
jgi:hypothetical protein